jgi:Tfp pilus assembly protein PilF
LSQARNTLTPNEAAALNAAFAMLQRGEADAAFAAVSKVLATARAAPAALHLYALCQRDRGDAAGAARSFEAALAGAPRDPNILNNYGAFLRRAGQPAQAAAKLQAALAIEPGRVDILLNLASTQMDLRDYRAAKASALRASTAAPARASPLLALASAQRELGEIEAAEDTLRQALKLEPNNGALWTALGVVRRLIGDADDALACYAKARACGYRSPELLDAEASAHLDLGDYKKALALACDLTAAAPTYVAGHVLLAHIQWEHGVGAESDPLAAFARAVAAQPQNHPLRAALINSLLEAERAEEALALIRVARAAQDEPALAAAHAGALHLLGDIDGAIEVLQAAAPRMGGSPGFCISFARLLVRAKRPEEAAEQAHFAAQQDPHNQEAWAMLSTAWRMAGDEREHWLCDYERLILVDDVEPPSGFPTQDDFIAALSEKLTRLHNAQHAPLNQSLRGGTQTSGSLFGRRDPIIAAAQDALRTSVERMIARLPDDPAHPFLSRRARSVSFSGSWSVRLRTAGRHVNHYHPRGWLSSAFYVQLPPSVAQEDGSRAGWIQFGQPPLQYETGLEPRRMIRPKVGRLVLFPSYMWHGTVPFDDDAFRMTMAFDALPAK